MKRASAYLNVNLHIVKRRKVGREGVGGVRPKNVWDRENSF